MRYVALLRGINVGGNNMIPMARLKACFEDRGFTDVSTYIQSGNVLFGTSKGTRSALTLEVEAMISDTFGLPISVVLRSRAQFARVVRDAPRGFGADPARYLYDVLFLKEPLTPKAALKEFTTRDGVDQVWAGNGVVYFARLKSRATQSHLSKTAGKPIYKQMTVRNWNTTTKILALLER